MSTVSVLPGSLSPSLGPFSESLGPSLTLGLLRGLEDRPVEAPLTLRDLFPGKIKKGKIDYVWWGEVWGCNWCCFGTGVVVAGPTSDCAVPSPKPGEWAPENLHSLRP